MRKVHCIFFRQEITNRRLLEGLYKARFDGTEALRAGAWGLAGYAHGPGGGRARVRFCRGLLAGSLHLGLSAAGKITREHEPKNIFKSGVFNPRKIPKILARYKW